MDYKERLLKRIGKKEAVIGVMGLGYVGLPLAVEMAKAGYWVVGIDVDNKKVVSINKGENYIGDVADEELLEVVKNERLMATIDAGFIEVVDCVIICVPTPIDKHLQPNLSYIEKATKAVANYLKEGTLVILESTTYPGTTEEVIKPILEERGLICNQEFFLAFSPERIDPGNKTYKTNNTPKVVGGVGEDSTKVAAELYRNVLSGTVYEVSSPAVAEMDKILENTYRNINIGLINEMAILCNRMGIDIWEVIEAAKTKPYGFQAFYPGPGIGGHCIPIDPYYLSWKAKEYDCETRLIWAASAINNHMPYYVVERTIKVLGQDKIPIKGAKVLVLGVAYKEDIDDIRESPALKIFQLLKQEGAVIMYNDPYIKSFIYDGEAYHSTGLCEETIGAADIIIIITKHRVYDYQMIIDYGRMIFDGKNATDGYKISRDNVVKL